ncbi:class 1b ribonucleoside-diphosphate reductase subunit beta [Lysinibacillus sp. 2017]|uniref:class 1b ribonucleoside-diphosphate reductase subunit beta n=1 Tax=unclassified Lysinibacillus TaxID=2636778 RepID=UPI000D526162|nr:MULTISPECIES: class 1b ribonucleoside-diphosphate reductase subunit beta [unclassified Lysinibacillus]AWE07684.1 class 1b ribonucleoside-diphosphate reductase subunit beta [Lysinibacillus sp. 2017]TGN36847.1 class 1b ribonucleoside-diphosphate reductase subunit beta [Lysinibacillus sp. S2017]
MSNLTYQAVNWNTPTSELARIFWDQQWKQIWFPEEIAVSKDVKQWKEFEHQDTYKKVFGGLTLLDTVQTNIGMNEIAKFTPDLQEKAVLTVFGAFEAIHAKSYSYIFTTLCTNTEIDEVFEWVQKNEYLQYKANRIGDVYKAIEEDDPESLWKGMYASVMLESFLFYSGFFYPLYLGGQGILRNSAEVISLIVRDESIHGVAVGYFAQNIFNAFSPEKQEALTLWGYEFLLDLYQNEMKYTEDLYAETGLSPEVKAYVRYNANKALMNLGFETMFPEEEINPIVMNGIANTGSTYDFFSQKGSTYAVAKVAPITDDTFKF